MRSPDSAAITEACPNRHLVMGWVMVWTGSLKKVLMGSTAALVIMFSSPGTVQAASGEQGSAPRAIPDSIKSLTSVKGNNNDVINSANRALEKIGKQLAKTGLDKTRLEERKFSITQLLDSEYEITNLPRWVKSPIFRRLFARQYNLRNRFETVKISLRPAHPRYRRLKARTGALNKEIYNEVFKIKIRLSQKLASAKRQEEKLANNFAVLTQKVAAAQKDRKKLQTLSRQAELSLVTSRKIKIEDSTRMLKKALREQGQNLLTSGENSSPRLVQLHDQFTELSMTLAAMSTRWSGNHPRIRQVRNHLNLLQHEIIETARKDIAKMNARARSLDERETALMKEAAVGAGDRVGATAIVGAAANSQQQRTVTDSNRQNLSLAYERKTGQAIQPDTHSLMDR